LECKWRVDIRKMHRPLKIQLEPIARTRRFLTKQGWLLCRAVWSFARRQRRYPGNESNISREIRGSLSGFICLNLINESHESPSEKIAIVIARSESSLGCEHCRFANRSQRRLNILYFLWIRHFCEAICRSGWQTDQKGVRPGRSKGSQFPPQIYLLRPWLDQVNATPLCVEFRSTAMTIVPFAHLFWFAKFRSFLN
jgi:hypothetical protein